MLLDSCFVKVSAGCPVTNVADIDFNVKNIMECIDIAVHQNSKLIVFPELCITSYTCADLFFQRNLIEQTVKGLEKLCHYSKKTDILIAVGAPITFNDKLYNCAVIIKDGDILGVVPKSYLPNNDEFYEKRWFVEGREITDKILNLYFQKNIPFGTDLIFCAENLKFGFEICEDLYTPIPPSSHLCTGGANIIGNLSASNEIVNRAEYIESLVKSQSARCTCAYVYSSAGVYESTTDLVFGGHLMISEKGTLMEQNDRFQRKNQIISQIIDVDKLNNARLKNFDLQQPINLSDYRNIEFTYQSRKIVDFDRYIDKHPFIPSDADQRESRCKEIFNIQTAALAKRLEHTGMKRVILGISGGLDSTLALLVAIKTFDMLEYTRKNILCVTMPGFGTSDKTYANAVNLCKNLQTDFREINIVKSCIQHFKDIGHSPDIHDTTYENVQARERTQILMDIANKEKALLIGTGDLSELALGWATYNGDHMSMYSVNCSVPKTLVRYLVEYVCEHQVQPQISKTLKDILNTPVSPELLPNDKANDEISQKTEELIGPYELHDFFLYHLVRQNSAPEKVFFLACHGFKDQYSPDVIRKWLNFFIKRFFTQQFKRSAVPDGPKIGTVSLSPRGNWKMPSDASFKCWLLK
ncbi:MAG: NAD(+) synthase [Clostridia bacterium]|nr:NAD(+) synthase [Clostridia bacterium]